jgi:hypothetical protein
MGNDSLPARLPFALFGFVCVILLVRWLLKDRASLLTWTLFGSALLGNVSFFLYFRQARYYGLAIVASVALVYLYLHWEGHRRQLIIFAGTSLALWGSNYLNYIALYCCLAADYMLWGAAERDHSNGATG